MFRRPGVPFFTKTGVGLFFAGFLIGGGIVFAMTGFESIPIAVQIGLMIGLAMMTIRWRIAEERVIAERKRSESDLS